MFSSLKSIPTASAAIYTLSGAHGTYLASLSGITAQAVINIAAVSSARVQNTTNIGTASAAFYAFSGALIADKTASAAAYVPLILYNTTSLAITASNYPQGSVLFVYT